MRHNCPSLFYIIVSAFLLNALPGVNQRTIAADKEDELRLFIDCHFINDYMNFIEKRPESSFADDSLIEISRIHLRNGDIDSAISSLEAIIRDYPDSCLHRHIFLNDIPDEQWMAQGWEEYCESNPIPTPQWAELLLADIYFSEKKEPEKTKNILFELLSRTRKPINPNLEIPAIIYTEDIRSRVLTLSGRVAKKTGDDEWLKKIEALVIEEYGIDPIYATSIMPLLERKKRMIANSILEKKKGPQPEVTTPEKPGAKDRSTSQPTKEQDKDKTAIPDSGDSKKIDQDKDKNKSQSSSAEKTAGKSWAKFPWPLTGWAVLLPMLVFLFLSVRKSMKKTNGK